jgi:hypothetical protein
MQADDKEHRKHKTLILGLRSNMTRKEAADALRQTIAARSELKIEKQPEMTFGQFWRERFLPMHQQKWKISSRQTQIDNIERYCVGLLEDKPLSKIDRFGLQMQANRLAEKFSRSVVNKFVTWSRAIRRRSSSQKSGQEVGDAGNPRGEQAFPHAQRDPDRSGEIAFPRTTNLSHALGSGTPPRRALCSAVGRHRRLLFAAG